MKEIIHYPNLKTILLIEDVLRNADLAISKNEIMRRMECKIMRQTLNVALDYMERHNLILIGEKGVLWIFNPNKKMANAVRKSTPYKSPNRKTN